jgi:hypothetical protein
MHRSSIASRQESECSSTANRLIGKGLTLLFYCREGFRWCYNPAQWYEVNLEGPGEGGRVPTQQGRQWRSPENELLQPDGWRNF